MENGEKDKRGQFWFGFFMGATAAAVSSYALKPKNSENITNKLHTILSDIEGHLPHLKKGIERELKNITGSEGKQDVPEKKSSHTIDTILQKIDGLSTQTKHSAKKFIVK